MRNVMLLGLLISVACGRPVLAEDWPEFRGPKQQGHSSATGLPIRWSDDYANLGWRTDIPGLGWSSPPTAGGLAWLTTAVVDDGSLRALAIDLATGTIEKDVEVFRLPNLGRIHAKNSHASPTPLIVNDRVVVHFGAHGTACLNLQGDILWRRTFDYGHFHGPGGSPIHVDGKVILACDGDVAQFVIALDLQTGETVWQTERTHVDPDRASGAKMPGIAFSTPLFVDGPAGPEIISAASDHVAGYDPGTGEELWWSSFDGYSLVPRPVAGHGMVYVSSGYTAPVLYAIRLGGRGDVTQSGAVWQLDRGAPLNPSPLLVDDALYLVNDRGILLCLDAMSGVVRWQQRLGDDFSGSPLFAQGLIYLMGENGMTKVVRPGSAYDEVAENRIEGRTLASLTPLDGGLLLRTDRQLLRIDGEETR